MKKKTLTVEQQRVLIAKDIIKQIKTRRYVAVTGCVVNLGLLKDIQSETPKGLQEKLKKAKRCPACARGAAALAWIERFDSIDPKTFNVNSMAMERDPVYGKVFTPLVRLQMETLFELKSFDWNRKHLEELELPPLVIADIIEWGRKNVPTFGKVKGQEHWVTNDERLISICKLIVKAKGAEIFVPIPALLEKTEPTPA